jgi:hypothetical protein
MILQDTASRVHPTTASPLHNVKPKKDQEMMSPLHNVKTKKDQEMMDKNDLT